MCLAQGHTAVPPVRHEPATHRSGVKHSTTALPNFLRVCDPLIVTKNNPKYIVLNQTEESISKESEKVSSKRQYSLWSINLSTVTWIRFQYVVHPDYANFLIIKL